MRLTQRILAVVLLAGPGFLDSRSLAQDMKYPGKVDWAGLCPAKTESSKDWVRAGEGESQGISLARPAFFSDGAELTIRYLLESQNTGNLIQLLKKDRPLVEFKQNIGQTHALFPVEFFDFDGNGLMDFKLVLLLGGCAGQSNTARVSYFFQHKSEWRLVSYFIRDPSYAWECDLDGDGHYELLTGHHQDKQKPGYHDQARNKWVGAVFRKYLVINAYAVGEKGLTLCNSKSWSLPRILSFRGDDPFDVSHDRQFLEYNQFRQPADCLFAVAKMLPQ